MERQGWELRLNMGSHSNATILPLSDLGKLLMLLDPPLYYLYNGHKNATSLTGLLGGLGEIMLVNPLEQYLTQNRA